MLALCVVNVLFRICHVQQTFYNVRHNYKWILLVLLARSSSSSPGASKSCFFELSIIEPAHLNLKHSVAHAGDLGFKWVESLSPHLTWNKQLKEEKSTNPATREGAKWQPELLVIILSPEPLTHPHLFSPTGWYESDFWKSLYLIWNKKRKGKRNTGHRKWGWKLDIIFAVVHLSH